MVFLINLEFIRRSRETNNVKNKEIMIRLWVRDKDTDTKIL